MIEAPSLQSLPTIRHGFFTRQGGHSEGIFATLNCGFGSGDEINVVANNRAAVATRIGVTPSRLMTVFQIHSDIAFTANEAWNVRESPHADAIVTSQPGLGIGILTADCASVLFADPLHGVIGAAHAGWKGAVGGICESTIAAMEKLGAERSGTTAVIGPTISQASYEVGPEFPAPFIAQDRDYGRFFRPSVRAGHFMFDLPGYLVTRLEAAGVGEVRNLDLCTYSDEPRFYSFRRATHRNEKHYGRQISAIALTG